MKDKEVNERKSSISLSHRIVVYGDDMMAAIVPNSAKPFNFQKEFALTEEMVGCRCQLTGSAYALGTLIHRLVLLECASFPRP